MSERTLSPDVLKAMRVVARAFVSQAPRVARDQVNAKADKLISESLIIAFPGCSAQARAKMMGVQQAGATVVPSHVRVQPWWSDDVVAELAAIAAPRRARLAELLRSAADRDAAKGAPLALWGGELRV